MSLNDKVILVTGGSGGMGLVTAKALAANGAHVVICGRNSQAGRQAVARIEGDGPPAWFLRCDISCPEEVEALLAGIVDRHGRLDGAFNNAGLTSEHARAGDASIDDWRRVIDVNLHGTFYCMKYELDVMSRHGGGVIVNNSSCAGLMAIPNQAAYVASKFAVVGLTQATAIEYGQARDGLSPVRVNAIAPGPILGGMNSEQRLLDNPERTRRKLAATAMGRLGDPREVASVVAWLLSDASSYLTGAVIPVDGGVTAGKF